MYNNITNFSKKISQSILNDIIQNNKINFKEYDLINFKNDILQIQTEYNKKTNSISHDLPRYWFFWEVISTKYTNFNKSLIKKKNISSISRCNKNINRTMFTKYLGFNPSILTLLIFHSEIINILHNSEFQLFDNFIQKAKFWPALELEKERINKCLLQNEINIVSMVCPDYDYNVIGKDLYSYTFDKLNETEGLGGKRILANVSNIIDFFLSENKSFSYDIFYGDFESFSSENCDRLKISEKDFIKKLKNSTKKMINHNIFKKVGFFISTFTTKKEWLNKKNININRINNIKDNNSKFKKEIFEIARSRRSLYQSWYPILEEKEYYKLVIDQGAEYATMGDIIFKNYKNPLIIGADHPRMKIFYYLNYNLPVIYLNKGY